VTSIRDSLARRAGPVHGLAMLVVVMSATSCAAAPRVICDYAAIADTIVGELVARSDATATFDVTSAAPGSSSGSRSKPPLIVNGQRIEVHYIDSQAQYLRVGRSYRVELWWLSNRFQSGVHVSSDACSTGTTYADGSAIKTSAARARSALAIGVGIAAFVFVVAIAAVFLRRRRRHRR